MLNRPIFIPTFLISVSCFQWPSFVGSFSYRSEAPPISLKVVERSFFYPFLLPRLSPNYFFPNYPAGPHVLPDSFSKGYFLGFPATVLVVCASPPRIVSLAPCPRLSVGRRPPRIALWSQYQHATVLTMPFVPFAANQRAATGPFFCPFERRPALFL